MHSCIRPHGSVALRLPSGAIKIVELTPNTNVSIGKFGSFPANLLLGRPYHATYEISDVEEGNRNTELRIVSAAELHSEDAASNNAPAETREENADGGNGGAEFDIVGENGELVMRSNRLTVDDPSRQKLTMAEIEELKKAGTGSGKEIIAKIMASHMGLEEKTSFSLAKYTLRKSKKYLRRFTALPVDVGLITNWVLDKEPGRILELREDMLGLIGSWANIHYSEPSSLFEAADGVGAIGGGRWLVIDDTGGLLVASLAEKMGTLYRDDDEDGEDEEEVHAVQPLEKGAGSTGEDIDMKDANGTAESPKPVKRTHHHVPAMSAKTNSLTLIHSSPQPNLGLLTHFGFDLTAADDKHPLYTHLKSISWLQLLHPEEDVTYQEPETVSTDILATWKSSKRGTYYRKRRRWERTKRVVDETRAGGFDGLVVASIMDPKNVLKHTVPLLRGGAQVVIYSPTIEPLAELVDAYSRERRGAYVQAILDSKQDTNESIDESLFPVNPTLLLGAQLQSARARHWQVLPGRTHPLMTSRGGADGFLFTATRVLPLEGKVEARGKFGKKKKAEPGLVEEPAAKRVKG